MDFKKILSHSTKKPQSILKMVLSFSVALLVIWLFLVSRMEFNTSPKVQDPEVQQRTEGLKNSLLERERARDIAASEGDSATAIATVQPAETQTVEQKDGTNMVANASTTFVIMVALLAGVWLWSKRKTKSQSNTEEDREVGNFVLGQGSQLKFVEINNEIWVLGMTQSSLNLLHRVPKSEWKESELSRDAEVTVESNSDFKSVYKFFKN